MTMTATLRSPWLIVIGIALGLGLVYGRAIRQNGGERLLSMRQAAQIAQRRLVLEAAGRGVVHVAVADLLVQPRDNSAVADQALLGDTVKILPRPQATDPFVEVETISKYRGFVRVESLTAQADGPTYAEDGTGVVATVVSRLANLYEKPDVTLKRPLVVAPHAVRLSWLSEHDERWVLLRLPDGRPAYAQKGDLELSSKPQFDSRCVIREALHYEGVPYLWGGRSPQGIDCSGLVSNVFRTCGVISPRDADQQYEWSALTQVEPTDVRAGDLLFFGKKGESGKAPRITHVGIALSREEFIHATTHIHPTVHRTLMSDAHFAGIRVGIRRHPSLQLSGPAPTEPGDQSPR